MKLKDIEFEYFIDYINKRVHLLNRENGFKLLSDRIDYRFQKDFIEEESLLVDVIDFDWFLYEVNGIIVLYKNSNYQLVNPVMPFLHKEYVEKLGRNRRIR